MLPSFVHFYQSL